MKTLEIFNVRASTLLNAPSYRGSSIKSLYRRHEQEKKREYGDRDREIEYASFTPLVFATIGGMGREAIADLLTYCPTRTMYHMTQCWHGLDAHYLSQYYNLPQCASAAASLSPTDQMMLYQRWACSWLTAPGTTRYI